jgi:HK97 family phage major capsid protein
MPTLLDDLTEKRRKVLADQRVVIDAAFERPVEQRSLTPDERQKCDQMDGELSTLDARIADIAAGEQRALQGIETVENTTRRPADPGAINTTSFASGKTMEQEAEELRSFFSKENRNGRLQFEYEIPLPNAVERRSLLDSSTPLPTSFVGQLYRYLVDTSSIRQTNPTVYSTSSGEQLVVPRSTAEGSAQWVAEAGNILQSDPTLSSVTLHAYKVAKLLQVSSELLADTGFDIVGYMAEHAGRNLGVAVDTAYVAGTGTTQPSGFIGSATVGITAATGTGSLVGLPTSGTVVGADVLIELYHSILPQYRARASYVMNDSTIKVVRKLKDTTGQYIWQPALVAGQPDTILGRPVFADPHMPVIGTSTKPIAFGDFAGYFIRDVTPIRFERSDDFLFGSDLIAFRAIYRTDGIQGDQQALSLYQTAAS